jgi:hypothetical protein
MSSKLPSLLAAVALTTAAGGAHAVLDTMASTNSSLVFLAYDRTGTATGSFLADLNYNFLDFRPVSEGFPTAASAQNITWNFRNNTISVDGALVAGNFAYGAEFDKFFAAVQSSELRWAVIAGDALNQQYMTTGVPTTNAFSNTSPSRQSSANTANMSLQDVIFTDHRLSGTHQTSDAGATFALATEQPYFPVVLKFGTNGNWNNNLRFNATVGNGASSQFFFIDNTVQRVINGVTYEAPEITTYGVPDVFAPTIATADFSTFTYNQEAGTLVWTSPIPEPGTYAMLMAGLAVVGFVARRRRV